MASRTTKTQVDLPAPPYKVIAEQIAALILVGKEAGLEQKVIADALNTFARACDASKAASPDPF